MFLDFYLFVNQLVAVLFTLIIPFLMLLGILWILAKALKGFIRSLSK
jgi:heme/copper-type cytochrome/quinol oxidase subunit 4